MDKTKDRENRFRGKGTRKHKAETQKLTPMDESTSRVVSPQKSLQKCRPSIFPNLYVGKTRRIYNPSHSNIFP